MDKALLSTDFNFKFQKSMKRGKVRDVYSLSGGLLAVVATDRISAFDVVLPRGIPHKGHILNQIAALFLDKTRDIVPNWKLATPDPMVTIGLECESYPVEIIVRGCLCGSAWRAYKAGERTICDVKLPKHMRENQMFKLPIITPTTKAEEGSHDENISKQEIIERGLIPAHEYEQLEQYAFELFRRGQQIAASRGLILADTKYEFGRRDGKIYLIDEIHTPDSSRYFYAADYEKRLTRDEPQRQLSKEFVREWLMSEGFYGMEYQNLHEMTDETVGNISARYAELYEKLTGATFEPADTSALAERIEGNIARWIDENIAEYTTIS